MCVNVQAFYPARSDKEPLVLSSEEEAGRFGEFMSSYTVKPYSIYTFQDNDSSGAIRITGAALGYEYTNSIQYGPNYPDWRKRIALADGCTTWALGKKLVKFSDKVSRFTANVKSPPADYNYNVLMHTNCNIASMVPGLDVYTFDPALYNSALSLFVSKARKEQYRFQAGTFFGEIRQTINLLKRPIQGLRKATRDYHRRAKRHAASKKGRPLHKALAEEWLTYSFGIRPLVADIDDVMHDLSYLTVGRPKTAPVKAWFPGTVVRISQSFENTPVSYWRSVESQSVVTKEECVIRGRVRVILPDATAKWTGSDNLRQAMSDFVPTVWNLIPYSFLVDYVSNIGDVLSALSFNSATVSWANFTKRMEARLEVKRTYFPEPYRYGVSWAPYKMDATINPLHAEAVVKSWERQAVGYFVPDVSWNLPTHWRQIANTVALIFSSRSVK
jgi:hypothetical protein